MEYSINATTLQLLSDSIATEMGLHFSEVRWDDLLRGISLAATDLQFNSIEDCINRILSHALAQHEIEKLACYLTIGETYFFREQENFNLLEKQILPELISKRRDSDRILRIWSAGCSTGEEIYTIAIILQRMLSDWRYWNISLLATDINRKALQKALVGRYGEWSFRGVNKTIKERYFTKISEDEYLINDDIRKMVTFEYLNLAKDNFPSLINNTNAIDIIFCRNILMYFSDAQRMKSIGKLTKCLRDEGWLIAGVCENMTPIAKIMGQSKAASKFAYQKCVQASNIEQKNNMPLENSITHQIVTENHCSSVINKPNTVSLIDECQKEQKLIDTARALSNFGQHQQALQILNQGINSNKYNPDLHYLAAAILEELGDHIAAEQALLRVLSLDNDYVLAYYSLGVLAKKNGNTEKCIELIDKVKFMLIHYGENQVLSKVDDITASRLLEMIKDINLN